MAEIIVTKENEIVRIHNLNQKAFQSHNTFPNGVTHGCRYELSMRQIYALLILDFNVTIAEANRVTDEISRIIGHVRSQEFIVDVDASNDPAHIIIHINK